MSDRGYTIKNQNAIHFITFAVVQWIDVFSRKDYADILVDSLKYCQKNKGLKIYAWCIMTNHVHLMIAAEAPNKLSDILRDLKKFTSNHILKAISENPRESRKGWMLWIFKRAGQKNNKNKELQFWQQDNHPIECDTNEIIDTRLNYIHENPVRAGMAWEAQDYIYSSAIDYSTEAKGLLEINFI